MGENVENTSNTGGFFEATPCLKFFMSSFTKSYQKAKTVSKGIALKALDYSVLADEKLLWKKLKVRLGFTPVFCC